MKVLGENKAIWPKKRHFSTNIEQNYNFLSKHSHIYKHVKQHQSDYNIIVKEKLDWVELNRQEDQSRLAVGTKTCNGGTRLNSTPLKQKTAKFLKSDLVEKDWKKLEGRQVTEIRLSMFANCHLSKLTPTLPKSRRQGALFSFLIKFIGVTSICMKAQQLNGRITRTTS